MLRVIVGLVSVAGVKSSSRRAERLCGVPEVATGAETGGTEEMGLAAVSSISIRFGVFTLSGSRLCSLSLRSSEERNGLFSVRLGFPGEVVLSPFVSLAGDLAIKSFLSYFALIQFSTTFPLEPSRGTTKCSGTLAS